MKSFLKLFYLFLGMLVLVPNSFAQKDYSAKLKKDLVVIKDGKYTATDYSYLKFSNGKTMQVEISANCPTTVMSRDKFVGYYTSYGMLFLFATFERTGSGIPDIKELDELIGEPDLTFNFVMAKNGMQIQVTSKDGTKTKTITWADFFDD